MPSYLTGAGWIVLPDFDDERTNEKWLTADQIASVNAAILAGSVAPPAAGTVIRLTSAGADNGTAYTLKGVGTAAAFSSVEGGGNPVTITGANTVDSVLTAVPAAGWVFTTGQWYLDGATVGSATAGLTLTQLSAAIGKAYGFQPTGVPFRALAAPTVAAPFIPSANRVALAGRGGWPGTTTTSTNNVRSVDTMYVAVPGTIGDEIGVISNFYLNNGGQSTSGLTAFTASGTKRVYGGAVTQMLWATTPAGAKTGATSIVVNPGESAYCYIPASPAGSFVHERVTTEGGVGNLTRLINMGTRSARYEGLAQSTVNTGVANMQAFTDGVDCVLQPANRDAGTGFINLPGNGTTGSVISAGVGWAAASTILLVDPVDGTVATFGFMNGAHTIGTMNASAGSGRSWNVGSYFVVVNTISGDTATHGLSARFGTVTSGTAACTLLITDSIGRGYGAGDGLGDLKANYGILERLLNNTQGFTSIGVIGNTATAFRDYFPTSGLKAVLDAVNVQYDEVIIELGDNDVAQPYSFTIIQNALTTIAAYWQAKGSKVMICTIPPRSSTTDGQTPLTPGFVDAGVRDQCNVAIRANTMIPSQRGWVEIATPLEDPVDHTKWAVGYTNDGIHPNDTSIRYALTTSMYHRV